MPLQMSLKGNLFAPIFICDYCQQPITDVEDGNYEWLTDEQADPEPTIYFTHKRCSLPFERRMGRSTMNMPLDVFFVYLGNNTNLNFQKAKRTVKVIALMG